MSNLVQILIALFGAAFLGSVIGWCARRIIALKDERYMRAVHEKNIKEKEAKTAKLAQQLTIGENKIAQLESEVNEIEVLDATLAANEQELDDIRREQTLQETQIQQRDNQIRELQEELNTQRLIARNVTSENRKLQGRVGDVGHPSARLNQSGLLHQRSGLPERLQDHAPNRSISIDMQSNVDDIDSDIADLTADLSAFEYMHESDDEFSDASLGALGQSTESGDSVMPDQQTAVASSENSDHSSGSDTLKSASEPTSESQSLQKQGEHSNSEQEEPQPNSLKKPRTGLFSSFNRRKKRS